MCNCGQRTLLEVIQRVHKADEASSCPLMRPGSSESSGRNLEFYKAGMLVDSYLLETKAVRMIPC